MVFRRSAFTRFPVRRRARANPKDGTLKVTSDQAQQNLARKVAKLSVLFGQLLRNGKFLSIRMVLPM